MENIIENYKDTREQINNILSRNEFPIVNKSDDNWSIKKILPSEFSIILAKRPKSQLFTNKEGTNIAKMIKIKKMQDLKKVINELTIYSQMPKNTVIPVRSFFTHYHTNKFAILYTMKKFDTELCAIDYFRIHNFKIQPNKDVINTSHQFIAKKILKLYKSLSEVCFKNKTICFDLRCQNILVKIKDKNGQYLSHPKVRLIDLDYCNYKTSFPSPEQACRLLYVIFYFNSMIHFTKKSIDVDLSRLPRWFRNFHYQIQPLSFLDDITWLENNTNYMAFFNKLGSSHSTKNTTEKNIILFKKIKFYLLGYNDEEVIDIIN